MSVASLEKRLQRLQCRAGVSSVPDVCNSIRYGWLDVACSTHQTCLHQFLGRLRTSEGDTARLKTDGLAYVHRSPTPDPVAGEGSRTALLTITSADKLGRVQSPPYTQVRR